MGRFVKGNPGGPGRPKNTQYESYLTATVAAVPLLDWIIIVRRAVEQAQAGNAKARDWLSRQLIGTDPIPVQRAVDDLQQALTEVLVYGKRLERSSETVAGNGAQFAIGPARTVDGADAQVGA